MVFRNNYYPFIPYLGQLIWQNKTGRRQKKCLQLAVFKTWKEAERLMYERAALKAQRWKIKVFYALMCIRNGKIQVFTVLVYESIIIDIHLSMMIAVHARELKCNSQQRKKKKSPETMQDIFPQNSNWNWFYCFSIGNSYLVGFIYERMEWL